MSGKLFVSKSYDIKAGITLVGLKIATPIDRVSLVTANVFLNPDSKNLFFRDPTENTAVVTDSFAFALDTQAADIASIGDQPPTLFIAKAQTDGFAVYEQSSYSLAKTEEDALAVSEQYAFSLFRSVEDSIGVSEVYRAQVGKNVSETISLAESLSRVVNYARVFNDAFTLDDLAKVDSFAVDTDLSKANIFSFSDAQSFGYEKAADDQLSLSDEQSLLVSLLKLDSLVVSDETAKSLDKQFAESFAILENVTIAQRNTASSVLNVGPLNYAPLNN